MLNVENINVFYGRRQALWDVSFDVGEGSLITIIGPNGAGKTTITRTVVGFLHPRDGKIKFREQEIEDCPPHKIGQMGISLVAEGRQLFRNMTVLENLQAGGYLIQKDAYQEALARVLETFPKLKERKSQKAKTLSGGEAQMLTVGRALMPNPDLLILDEPSLGLAPNLVTTLFERITSLNEGGLTILIVEQHVGEVLKISSRAYLLENGSVVKEAPSEQMLEDEHVKNSYLGL